MGTNYYLETLPPCPHCGRESEKLHIGKSSAGWHFGLHIYPELGINTLEDWKNYWKGKPIWDEYGHLISEEEMLETITEREFPGRKWNVHPLGYESWQKFHKTNYSQKGLNGLLRRKIGSLCVGHSEGTWDYMEGEFS
jgi:hypothetical protein